MFSLAGRGCEYTITGDFADSATVDHLVLAAARECTLFVQTGSKPSISKRDDPGCFASFPWNASTIQVFGMDHDSAACAAVLLWWQLLGAPKLLVNCSGDIAQEQPITPARSFAGCPLTFDTGFASRVPQKHASLQRLVHLVSWLVCS